MFEEDDLSQLRVQYMSGTMNALQESLLFHNPPQQKLAQLRCDLSQWTREKRSVLEELFPPGSPVTKSPAKKSPTRTQSPVKRAKKPAKAATPEPTEAQAQTALHARPLTSPTSKRSKTAAANTRRSMFY